MIAKTNSRSHLGTLNDFANMLGWQLHGQEDLDLVQAAIELAHTPVVLCGRWASPTKSHASCWRAERERGSDVGWSSATGATCSRFPLRTSSEVRVRSGPPTSRPFAGALERDA